MSTAQDTQGQTGSDTPLKLVVFGADAAEAAQIKRMRSYIECGFDVIGFMMRRANMNRDFEPFWKNVHLFETENNSFARRVGAVVRSVIKLRAHRDELAGTDVIVARNLDMLAIAAAARRMIHPRPALIYECLDIHELMTNQGRKGRLVRAAERWLLRQTASLILSSPAFLREYFEPVQGWTGPVALVENKLWIEEGGPARPDPSTPAPPDGSLQDEWSNEHPMVIAWVGTLRCAQSLDILAETADLLGPAVKFKLHGVVHHHAIPDFDAIVNERQNMHWHGPYAYPDDLAPIYKACHLVWSQDLWQWGTNSTWLLPNRIYEASYFGCPSIAVAGTETGRRAEDGLGWSIPAPSADALVHLVEALTPTIIADRRRALLERPASEFRQDVDEIKAAIYLGRDAVRSAAGSGA